jgi:hypothetical protein
MPKPIAASLSSGPRSSLRNQIAAKVSTAPAVAKIPQLWV